MEHRSILSLRIDMVRIRSLHGETPRQRHSRWSARRVRERAHRLLFSLSVFSLLNAGELQDPSEALNIDFETFILLGRKTTD